MQLHQCIILNKLNERIQSMCAFDFHLNDGSVRYLNLIVYHQLILSSLFMRRTKGSFYLASTG